MGTDQYKYRRKARQPQMLLVNILRRLLRLMSMSSTKSQSAHQSQTLPATAVIPSRRKTTTANDEPRIFTPFTSLSGLGTALPVLGPICTVLLVDDNIINQTIGARMLISLGYRVYVAHDGQDAISQICVCAGISPPATQETPVSDNNITTPPPRPARSKSLSALTFRRAIAPDPIDVVLMDYQMPIKDGMTATREIREMESAGKFKAFVPDMYFSKRWRTRLPIIASTTLDGQEVHDALLDAGVDGFTKKPFSVESLRETVEAFMTTKQHNPTTTDVDQVCDCCASCDTV